MKKLLIAAAIVCAAVISQAASTDWKVTCGNMKDHTGTASFSGTYQLYATGGDLSSDLLVLTIDDCGTTLNQKAFTVASGLTVDQSYNFYYTLVDSAGYTLTSAKSANAYKASETGAPVIALGNQATFTGNPSNWKAAAAPEPTSGLLLLLGVAGLALKRRRA